MLYQKQLCESAGRNWIVKTPVPFGCIEIVWTIILKAPHYEFNKNKIDPIAKIQEYLQIILKEKKDLKQVNEALSERQPFWIRD